jgi:hypothetical protein
MTQPGHATDIYDDRYVGQTQNTDFPEESNRPGTGAYDVQEVNLGAASGVFSIAAPFDGVIRRVALQSQTTTDATNKITLAITNESNSAASIVASTTYDDDPVATTNTEVALTLSTTAANLVVTQGDNIEVAYTEAGTIAGGVVTIWFDNY